MIAPQHMRPEDIERRSMEIITEELGGRAWPEPEFSIIKRCIHTSADFEYADILRFSPGAAMIGVEALRKGTRIVTDTMMAAAGINKRISEQYGVDVHCYMSDPDVAIEAASRGCTRASVCMERAAAMGDDPIFVIGNAPTALIALYELIMQGRVKPTLIIGAPVGFVNIMESKEQIMRTDIPFIVPVGRRGGSNIAATIVNAMFYYGSK